MTKKTGFDLLKWYEKSKRDLPWRKTKDPYLIWISEIVLQQTRIDQGLSYYLRFVSRFPNVEELAKASEDEVLKYWQGLGYYSRARNLHASAIYIQNKKNGIFPCEYDQILNLKGVGPYTAAAIASIAFSLPHPVIDGNVNRVISRYFGVEKAVNTTEGAKEIKEKLNLIFIKEDSGNFNQAIMELGALICKPSSPNCNECILNHNCVARSQNRIKDLPFKIKLNVPKEMYLYFFVLNNKKGKEKTVYLNKRNKNSIWKNLYDFPSIESETERDIKGVITEFAQNYSLKDLDSETSKFVGPINHKLTHRNIMAYFIEINVNSDFKGIGDGEFIKVKYKELKEYAVPKLIDNYIKGHLLK
jgi:A/G-specific adenine glycosylase